MSESIVQSLLFALSLVLAVAGSLQLVYQKKNHVNILLLSMYLSLSYTLFYFWMTGTGHLPHILLSTDMSIVFLIGPSFYIYFSMLAGVMQKSLRPVFVSQGVFAAVFILIIVYNLFFPEEPTLSKDFIPYFSVSGIRKTANSATDYFLFLCSLSLVLKLVSGGVPYKKRDRHSTMSFVMGVCFLTGTVVMLATHFYQSTALVVISIGCYCIIAFSFLYYSYRYLNETQVLPGKSTMSKLQEEDLPLWAKGLGEKIHQLFDKDHIYRDPEISLAVVSQKLGITENQLSLLVNTQFNMNFRTLLNSFRLEEARSLLRSRPDMKILEIAFHTGFNSKSSFNTLFKSKYGKTPNEYRSEQHD